ncbi:hypothetical protein Fmac_023910 [Flemingia macrophylla]|uniref:Uncharacterized protein n=1 Tax=Flemingia macrophylla TaxID=520843 RepID=A0ABD1LMV0_9FABA
MRLSGQGAGKLSYRNGSRGLMTLMMNSKLDLDNGTIPITIGNEQAKSGSGMILGWSETMGCDDDNIYSAFKLNSVRELVSNVGEESLEEKNQDEGDGCSNAL